MENQDAKLTIILNSSLKTNSPFKTNIRMLRTVTEYCWESQSHMCGVAVLA